MASYGNYSSSEEEISIKLYHVSECSGNIKKLESQWNDKKCVLNKKSSSIMSQGYVADEVFGEGKDGKGMLAVLDEISENTSILLGNSVAFFENLGITFADVDKKTAKTLRG